MTTGERRSNGTIWTNLACSRPRDIFRYFNHIGKRTAGLSGTYVDDILRTGNQSFNKYATKLINDAFYAKKPVGNESTFTGLRTSGQKEL